MYGMSVPNGFNTASNQKDSCFDTIAWMMHLHPTGNLDNSTACELRTAAVEHIQNRRVSDRDYENALHEKYCGCSSPDCDFVNSHMLNMSISCRSGKLPEARCLHADDVVILALCELLCINLHIVSAEQHQIEVEMLCGGLGGRDHYVLHHKTTNSHQPLLFDSTHNEDHTL